MAQDVSNANMTSMLLRSILSSWYARIVLLMAFVAVAGAAYWYRDSISLTAVSVEEGIISRLGLGVVAVALWLVVFTFAIFVHQSLFRHYRLWLASPFLLAFLLGVLSFFAPFQGPLARFTLEGDVTLGGAVGYAIAGEIVWLGVLRVAAVLAVAVAIVAPGLALGALSLLGSAFFGMYILAMSVGGAIGSMFKARPKSDKSKPLSPSESPSPGRWSESLRQTMEMQEFRERVSPTSAWEPRSEYPEPDLDDSVESPIEEESVESLERPMDAGLNGLPAYLAETQPPERRSAFAPDLVNDAENGNGAVEDDMTDHPLQDADDHDVSGLKFNRLWGGGAPDSENGGLPPGPS